MRKLGWFDVPDLVMLYSLYRLAESKSDYNLTVSQLMEEPSLGPIPLFGLDRDTLVKSMRSMASNYPRHISINIVRDLDNVRLDSSISSLDVAGLS